VSRFAPVRRADWIEAPPGLAAVARGSVTTPPGFAAGAAACGLKASGALDIGLLRSVPRAVSAMVDTASALPAAPVLHNRGLDRAALQAVVVNAGVANAATGAAGLEDARAMGAAAARALGLGAGEVAVSSTGVIGERFDLARVLSGVAAAAGALSPGGGPAFAEAMRTTDRWAKSGAFRVPLGHVALTLGAAAKGGGMISPRMATMLAYVTTDAAVAAGDLAALTAEAAAASFNRATVDGQMSPSDTLIVLANGAGPPLQGSGLEVLGRALRAVCRWLAVQMVKDGEGAEHAVRILVRGARDEAEADAVARAVGDSPLVKTAAFGRDANWGRVLQAVGQALAGRGGAPPEVGIGFDGRAPQDPGVADVLALPEYDLEIALGRGGGEAELWASDLGHGYVSLNAEYRT
jgi:glutamate N-acetyltransferase/amino-acid N-acetyltransferase